LLSQVDSAIGGKTAINLQIAKNIIGAFYQPCSVVADVRTLKNLLTDTGINGEQEIRNSFAEVIKYGVISDPFLFRMLEKKSRPYNVSELDDSLRPRLLAAREKLFSSTIFWNISSWRMSIRAALVV